MIERNTRSREATVAKLRSEYARFSLQEPRALLGFWLVGGAIRSVLTFDEIKDFDHATNDVELTQKIFENHYGGSRRETPNAITWFRPDSVDTLFGDLAEVQLLKRQVGYDEDILTHINRFDLRMAQIAWDGGDALIASDDTISDILHRNIHVTDGADVDPVNTTARVFKFHSRGWRLEPKSAEHLLDVFPEDSRGMQKQRSTILCALHDIARGQILGHRDALNVSKAAHQMWGPGDS